MGLSHEHIGPKILTKTKIYLLTRAELLFPLCHEIPCIYHLFRSVQLPKWKSVDGDCFKPFNELCQIEWSTIMVWVFLLMTTIVLGLKEAFQLMHSQKVSSIYVVHNYEPLLLIYTFFDENYFLKWHLFPYP
jgi:hypothetical protein